MSLLLKQSTLVTIRLGPFLDATDGVTEEVGLGSMGVELSKNHAAFGARNSATATAHDAEGWYSCELDTTDTNTLGPLIVKAHAAATHLPVWCTFMVVPAQVYEASIAGSLPRTGTAQGGAAGSITLDAGASATTDFYNGCLVVIVSGTGSGQAREITAYDGGTKVATVNANWVTNPDATSIFMVIQGL